MGVGGIRWKKNKLEREKMGGKKRNKQQPTVWEDEEGEERKWKRASKKNWTHTGLIIHTQ